MNSTDDELRNQIEQEINAVAANVDREAIPPEMGLLIPSVDLQSAIDRIMWLIDQPHLALSEQPSWTIELPDLPYFQISAFNQERGKWISPIYQTKNLPVQIKSTLNGEVK